MKHTSGISASKLYGSRILCSSSNSSFSGITMSYAIPRKPKSFTRLPTSYGIVLFAILKFSTV